ncbi:MAG: DinB family protein [Roseivirga sp.]|nr:DinB family protein [Roseivirga sp.]
MKNWKTTTLLGVILLAFTSQSVKAQAITVKDALAAWDKMATMVVESARLMPAADFDFSPGEPLRNFANQLNHTTASNIGFAQSVKAGRPDFAIPDRNNPPQEKEAVIDILEKSFAYFRAGLEHLTESDLEQTVPWGRPGSKTQITRLKAILIITSHLQREHGKTMMYLRARGIVPAPAGSWTF